MVDGANMTTGQTDQYCLTSQGGPLGVALVWHDPPALLSAQTALVNNLDLTVRAAGLNGYPLLVRPGLGMGLLMLSPGMRHLERLWPLTCWWLFSGQALPDSAAFHEPPASF